MMRFATLSYVPNGTPAGASNVDGKSYLINGGSGSDTYIGVTGFLGNWETKLYTNIRSTSYKVPTNIPVGVTVNPQIVTTGPTGIRFAYGKSNIHLFGGLVMDSIEYAPVQSTISTNFEIKTEPINYVSVGGALITSGSRPQVETKGSLEIQIPISSPTINGKPVTVTYNSLVTVEVKFGARRAFGLMGSLGFMDYKDTNEYHINHFSGGLVFGF